MTNTGYTPEEPIAAIATALAPGAIGIVRASGKNCIELAAKFFSRPKALLSAAPNTIVYGWIKDPARAEQDCRVDEVMAAVYRAPKSFTGEDMIEIFCHGGVSVVRAVFALFLRNGFRRAERGEFTFRAYINGRTDLTRAEAVREIIESKTDISRTKAAARLSGTLTSEIASVKKLVVDTLASIEVEIEYPEDEENISDTFDPSDLNEARQKLMRLSDSWKSEKLYQDGARVVLCGKTNAGKSSLFNSLLKEDRAIVSDIEGTTRDWLESWADFDGIPVRLFDTAGLRSTSDEIEAKGVELAKDLSSEADVLLYLVDSRTGLSSDDTEFLKAQNDIPVILVWNKCDSPQSKPVPKNDGSLYAECASVSAKRGDGVGELAALVRKILLAGTSSQSGITGLGSERQKASVNEALERVNHALEILSSGEYGLDAVVQDLEDSLDSLGEVTGEVTPDDILRSVFSRFCVGK